MVISPLELHPNRSALEPFQEGTTKAVIWDAETSKSLGQAEDCSFLILCLILSWYALLSNVIGRVLRRSCASFEFSDGFVSNEGSRTDDLPLSISAASSAHASYKD